MLLIHKFFPKTLLNFLCLAVLTFSLSYHSYADSSVSDVPTLKKVNSVLEEVLFFDLSFGAFNQPAVDYQGTPLLNEDGQVKLKTVRVPLVVIVLLGGGLFFTFYYGLINIRGFKHAIELVTGRHSKANEPGEVTHFKALTSALSATVGLGNIAGVAMAIQLGGPGATFWMIICGFLGMSSKFSEVVLAQMYRRINAQGQVTGGPMYYLDSGLKEFGGKIAMLGKFLAIIYAVLIMLGAIGGGCMFQANQTVESFMAAFSVSEDNAANYSLLIGIILAIFVAAVILGGIKRIGSATSKIVPAMCGIYILAALFVIAVNYQALPTFIPTILDHAFNNNAFAGGIVGVLVAGMQRAAFSNEAGLGSASIAHAAAKTKEPVREGLVALLEPFIDTIVICTLTAAVVILTGTWNDPQIVSQATGNVGVTLTSEAFKSVIPWFPYVLTLCVLLFAFSSMIAWCYYGERGWIYIFNHFGPHLGEKSIAIYRSCFVFAVVVGAVNSLDDVINFTDMLMLSLAIPNIIGSLFLAKKVKGALNKYWRNQFNH